MNRLSSIQNLNKIANILDKMSLHKEATSITNIMAKIAQIQTNKYKAEDINIIEQNNGNFLDIHNLGKLYPNETFTAMQAQSLANRIYKRDKNLVDNNITFQVRHNDNNTLDIMVNIQDNLK